MPEYITWLQGYVEMLKSTTSIFASTIDDPAYRTKYEDIANRVFLIAKIEDFIRAERANFSSKPKNAP